MKLHFHEKFDRIYTRNSDFSPPQLCLKVRPLFGSLLSNSTSHFIINFFFQNVAIHNYNKISNSLRNRINLMNSVQRRPEDGQRPKRVAVRYSLNLRGFVESSLFYYKPFQLRICHYINVFLCYLFSGVFGARGPPKDSLRSFFSICMASFTYQKISKNNFFPLIFEISAPQVPKRF